MDMLALAEREKLPDALRVLLREYPREMWEHDAGLDGLVRFWLDRHLMFRHLLDTMQDTTEALLDQRVAIEAYVQALSRNGGMFVNGLHEHHMIEDSHYFPKLTVLDERIAKGFEILERDHHDIDALLGDFVSVANEVIGLAASKEPFESTVGGFHKDLQKMARLLDRHLTDEEELVVPVILKYGAPDPG
ncbi:hemerythrin domain-containing protein [Cognatiyoonia sp. IB215182]|uniref:hemerythrin domain-containing protein n=1 Tax=Cognatiyoonia sp. IB215182 TaxID=3097353 RepID=UPI002A0FE3CD|nr:hemerythrin domain-containing protein [Cognatiyoonia sp. IB215182]MDX8355094.1 hemerythrin domain-containing protein [Cognatiyoonia sp. IB215182]